MAPSSAEPRVLLVGDCPGGVDALRRALREGGLDTVVEQVAPGPGVHARLAEGIWDLVLAGTGLDNPSAPALIALARETGGDLPTLVMAKGLSDEATLELLAAGAADVVSPLTGGLLAHAVVRALREAHERRARKIAELRARRLTYRDQLTELPNLNALRERPLGGPAPGAATGLILLKLDDPGELRNALEQRQLDTLLRAAVFRLASRVRAPAVLAHLAYCSFGVFLPSTTSAEARALATAFAAALRPPFQLGALRVRCDVSCGFALATEDAASLDSLLRRAHVAAGQAQRRQHAVAEYDADADPHNPGRLQLAADLWGAADRGEFQLEFQPVVDLRTGSTTGLEALARWHQPGEVALAADSFVALAERTGSIRELTSWLLREAIGKCAQWRAGGIPLGVSLNLSSCMVRDHDLADTVMTELHAAGLPPWALTVEVAEAAVQQDRAAVCRTLTRLRAEGVRALLDDYGSGHCSLASLRDLPVDGLKLHRGLFPEGLDNPRDQGILHATISLAHYLGLEVVAQGIEDRTSFAQLRMLGCDYAQGFFMSPSLPDGEIGSWLATGRFPAGVPGLGRPLSDRCSTRRPAW